MYPTPAAETRHALRDPGQAEAGAAFEVDLGSVGGVEADTIVGDGEDDVRLIDGESHQDFRRASMLEGIRDGFLGDAPERVLEIRGLSDVVFGAELEIDLVGIQGSEVPLKGQDECVRLAGCGWGEGFAGGARGGAISAGLVRSSAKRVRIS